MTDLSRWAPGTARVELNVNRTDLRLDAVGSPYWIADGSDAPATYHWDHELQLVDEHIVVALRVESLNELVDFAERILTKVGHYRNEHQLPPER